MSHNVSTRDGRVTADDKARLVAAHGRDKAAEIVAEVEAQFHPDPAPVRSRRRPVNGGLKPRARKPAVAEAAPVPPSETEE